jgi:hypothetical protein
MKLMRLVKTIFILMLITASANFSDDAGPLPLTQPKVSATTTIMAKPAIATALAPGTETDGERLHQRRLLVGLIAGLLAVAVVYLVRRKRKSAGVADR